VTYFTDTFLNTARLDPLFRCTAGEVGAHFKVSALFGFFGKSLVLSRPFPTFSRPLHRLGALFNFVGHRRRSCPQDRRGLSAAPSCASIYAGCTWN
jgi:hypothetical protein